MGEGTCSQDGKPYAKATIDPIVSVDGESAILCTLRTTTCPAFLQHSKSDPACSGLSPTSDDACGAADTDDAIMPVGW